MDFFEIINSIITFFQDNLLIAIATGLLLVCLLFKKLKFFLTVFFIALILIGVFYLITSISDVGVSHKKTIIDKKIVP